MIYNIKIKETDRTLIKLVTWLPIRKAIETKEKNTTIIQIDDKNEVIIPDYGILDLEIILEDQ